MVIKKANVPCDQCGGYFNAHVKSCSWLPFWKWDLYDWSWVCQNDYFHCSNEGSWDAYNGKEIEVCDCGTKRPDFFNALDKLEDIL